MKVLLLGGTGAMGTPLQRYLIDAGHDVYVTSRSNHSFDPRGVQYLIGDAHDVNFLKEALLGSFDVIVDFMSYNTLEFSERVRDILNNTRQYIFMSSARVYAPSDGFITEDSPRLLDVCIDSNYLATDEYAISKARQENVLIDSGYHNYTIVRPSLTYNSKRLQYALGEKELWLYRYLHGEKIVFPKNMENIYNTMSYGDDVARAIFLLIGNENAFGEAVHIAGTEAITWGEVNKTYCKVLKEKIGLEMGITVIDSWEMIGHYLGNYYQLKYARAINRKFDKSKLSSIVGNIDFVSPHEGLIKCLNIFLESDRQFNSISWKNEAFLNRITGDKGDTSCFSCIQTVKYLLSRYTPSLPHYHLKR